MKKLILITALLVPTMFGMAEETERDRSFFGTIIGGTFLNSLSGGINIGTDVGAAMPIPISDAFGPNDEMNVSLRMRLSFGVSFMRQLNDRWSLSLDGTRRNFGMSALARVDEQIILIDREADRWQGFRGVANMEMVFPMFELALLGRYALENINGRLIFGVYYSRIRNATFVAESRQGMLFDTKLVNGRQVIDFSSPPIGIISIEDPQIQDLSPTMSRWDFGITAGYEHQILLPQLFVSARVSKGFNSIFHPDHRYLTFNMRQIRGSFALSYNFRSR